MNVSANFFICFLFSMIVFFSDSKFGSVGNVFQYFFNCFINDSEEPTLKYIAFFGFCSIFTGMSEINVVLPNARPSSITVLQPSKSEGWTIAVLNRMICN